MKEFIAIIKKLWENKKTRSLAILILYGIFFIFVFALINSAPSVQPKPVVPTNPFDYLKNKGIEKIEFSGLHQFIYQDEQIYYNELIYNIDERPEELLMYDFLIFNTDNIYNLLNKSILESTNHVLNSNTYVVAIKDFVNIVLNEHLEIEGNIRITMYENDSNILEIDFNEYYGYTTKIYLRS